MKQHSDTGIVLAGKGPAYEQIKSDLPNAVAVGNGELVPGRLLLSVQYSRIVGAVTLADYEYALNLHFGPLPELRGCFPTKWAIINNEPAGVTLHHMTPRIDDGPILSVWTFHPGGLTDKAVYERCTDLAVSMFVFWKERIVGFDLPEGTPQDDSRAKYYRRELPYGGRLPEPCSDELRERLTRAFTHPPYPGLSSQ